MAICHPTPLTAALVPFDGRHSFGTSASAAYQDLHFDSLGHCDRHRLHSAGRTLLSTANLFHGYDFLSRLDFLRHPDITISFDRGHEPAGTGIPGLVDDEDMLELTDSDFEDIQAPADDALVKRCAHRG